MTGGELSERVYESRIRTMISDSIIANRPDLILMDSKKAVDILICKSNPNPALFFVEVKFHKKNHGRLGFGSKSGIGFQPEILSRLPDYFSGHMRWIIGEESQGLDRFIFLNNQQMRQYVSGGAVGQKFNNIQKRLFREAAWLSEEDLVSRLTEWVS